MKYTNVYWERKEFRCEKPEEWAVLYKQKLINRDGYHCRGRCINYYGYFDYGKWQREGAKFDCDFVESQCWTDTELSPGNYNALDMQGSIHFQLIEKETFPPVPSPKQYNIYVIVVDSVAFHQARRNLPKTLFFMDRELKAVEFSYVNKLGKNSYPNAIPLWYGKATVDIEKQMLKGQNKTPAQWEKVCKNPKKAIHIMKDAKRAGYQTLLSEFWMTSMLKDGDEDCGKYTVYFRPDHETPPLYNWELQQKLRTMEEVMSRCERFRKGLSEQLSYFRQFMYSYKEKPKFGMLWLSAGSHEYEQESMLEDTELYDFFIQNKEEFSKSFVFFMSDHGLRFGNKMDLDLGEYDNRNPFLSISIPKELRGGPLMANLRKNSQQLQTHYDTRATWLDIIKFQQAVNFTAARMQQFDGEKGSSYLREQPGPRTCHTLPIPFQFCICEYKMEQIDSNSQLAMTVANFTVDGINRIILENVNGSRCGLWKLKGIKIEGYYPVKESGTFKILLMARQEGMETAKFRATVRVDNTGQLELIFVGRVDPIWITGRCIKKGKLREFCHCLKKQPKEESTDTLNFTTSIPV